MKNNSKTIIEAIKSGKNQEALQYLYKDPLNKIKKFVLKNSGSLDDAHDVFQEAVITLYHYIYEGKYNEAYDLDGFLYRVARNKWVDMVRKNRKISKEDAPDVAGEDNPLEEMISEERMSAFRLVFSQLEDNCRKMLSLSVFEKKTMKEIAGLMDYKDESVAKNMNYKCKKKLSALIHGSPELLKALKY